MLGQSFVAKNPETPFWKAHALAGQNRFAEAVEIFIHLLGRSRRPLSHGNRASPGPAFNSRSTSRMPRSTTLAALIQDADAAAVASARLNQVEILLDLERTADARPAMPPTEISHRPAIASSRHSSKPNCCSTRAIPTKPQTGFQELVNQPQGQSLPLYHCGRDRPGRCDSSSGKSENAAKSLLAFLQDHPDSPDARGDVPAHPAMAARKTRPPPIRCSNSLAQWITPPVLPATGPDRHDFDTERRSAACAWPAATVRATDLSGLSPSTPGPSACIASARRNPRGIASPAHPPAGRIPRTISWPTAHSISRRAGCWTTGDRGRGIRHSRYPPRNRQIARS